MRRIAILVALVIASLFSMNSLQGACGVRERVQERRAARLHRAEQGFSPIAAIRVFWWLLNPGWFR